MFAEETSFEAPSTAPPEPAPVEAPPAEAVNQAQPEAAQVAPPVEKPINAEWVAANLGAYKQLAEKGYVTPLAPDDPEMNKLQMTLLNNEPGAFAITAEMMEIAHNPNVRVSEALIEQLTDPARTEQLKAKWLGTANEPGLINKEAIQGKTVAEALPALTGVTDEAGQKAMLTELAENTAQAVEDKLNDLGAKTPEEEAEEAALPEEVKKERRLAKLGKILAEFGVISAQNIGMTLVDSLQSVDMSRFMEFLFTFDQRGGSVAYQKHEWEKSGIKMIDQQDFQKEFNKADTFEAVFVQALKDVSQGTMPNGQPGLSGQEHGFNWDAFKNAKDSKSKEAELQKILTQLYELTAKSDKKSENWQKVEAAFLYRINKGDKEKAAKQKLDPRIRMQEAGGMLYELVANKNEKLFKEVFGEVVGQDKQTEASTPATPTETPVADSAQAATETAPLTAATPP